MRAVRRARPPVRLLACFLVPIASHAAAQSADPGGPAVRAESGEAASRPSPAEPGFRLVNLPTTLRLPEHRSSFDVVHRFNGNLARGSFGEHASNLFGLDQGAAIGIEYRFGITSRLQAVAYRTNIDKTFQFTGKYDLLRQEATSPVSLSALVAVEGADNFQERRTPSIGAALTRTVHDRLALHASPIWIHDTAVLAGEERDTWLLGIGARLRVRPTVYLVGEAAPRLAGYAPGVAEFSLALEKRAGLHLFQLSLSNSQATTFGQLASGGFEDTLHLGFNLTRKFY